MTERRGRVPRAAWLRHARQARGWTQAEAAAHLGVSQGYLSLLERGARGISPSRFQVMRRVYDVPETELPLVDVPALAPARLAAALARLGYPPLAHLRGRTRLNPATVILGALRRHDLEARLTEALPWVALRCVDLDWTWLLERAKVHDVQNRLAYVLALADELAGQGGHAAASRRLRRLIQTLERSRLAKEDTLCCGAMTGAERKWLRARRSRLARHWNLLTDLRTDRLPYAP